MRRIVGLGLACLVAACGDFKKTAVDDAGASDAALTDGGSTDASANDGAATDAPAGPDGGGPADGPAAGDTGASDGSTACGGDGGCPTEVVASGLLQASVVIVDANNVYVSDTGSVSGEVYQCAKTGCAKPTPLGPGYATGLAVDGTNVYWNDFIAGSIVACTIGGCGGVPKVIAPSQTSAENVCGDGTNLYWSTEGDIVTCVPPGCTSATILVTGQGAAPALAAASGVAYWMTTNANGEIESCGAGGCDGMPHLVNAAGIGGSIAVHSGTLYFTVGNAILSCQETGCVTPVTIGSSPEPTGIASDGVSVYWLDEMLAYVYRCPVTGCTGATQFTATELGAPGANVALDDDYVYWTTPTQVLRKHK
ncbi:MAG: hypothetical protein ABSE49_09530 [Polyangiaceae bacterium]